VRASGLSVKPAQYKHYLTRVSERSLWVSLCLWREMSKNAQLTLLPVPLTGHTDHWPIPVPGPFPTGEWHGFPNISGCWRTLTPVPKWKMLSTTTFYRAVHAKLCHLLFKGHLNKNTMVCVPLTKYLPCLWQWDI